MKTFFKTTIFTLLLLHVVISCKSQQYINDSMSDDVIYVKMGDDYLKKQENDKALESYTKAIGFNPKNVDAWEARGYVYLLKTKYNLAEQDFTKAIQLNPKSYYAYNNRAFAKICLKNYKAAIKDCKMAIKINPEKAYHYNNLGFATAMTGQLKKGLEYCNHSLSIDPNNSWGYYFRGLIKLKLKNTSDACTNFYKAKQLGLTKAEIEIAKNCKKT